DPKLLVVDSIIAEDDLYKVLAVPRNAKPEEIRRGFLNRSRVCHPDKFPTYPASTIAFQKVALAYETLSKPSSRRMYDVSGRTDFAAAVNNSSHPMSTDSDVGLGEETLNGVLYSILCEFLEGDFDMIRVFVQAMNDGGSGRSGSSGSGLQVGAETVENLEGAFRKVREMMLAGKRYVKVIQNELIRLYEIQQNLRSLSYFDVFGRLRLTLQLARVTLSIPMAVDQAMKEQ
ncbi:DnaJ-domain-containing protein, partial [Violaceomyces palustris]